MKKDIITEYKCIKKVETFKDYFTKGKIYKCINGILIDNLNMKSFAISVFRQGVVFEKLKDYELQNYEKWEEE